MFLYIYTFLGFYATRVCKNKDEGRKPGEKKVFVCSLKKTRFKYITLKRNENEFSLLRRCRPCFSAEKRVSVEIRRSKTLASKFSRLYYNIETQRK